MTGHRSEPSIKQFWDHCRALDEWRDHPCLDDPELYGSIMVGKWHVIWFRKNIRRTPVLFLTIEPRLLQGTIPFCLHVDGAEFYSNSEYVCWSMCSALATDHVFDTKFPLVVLPHHCMQSESVKQHVQETVATVISWSLKHSARCTRPTTGAFGEELNKERLTKQDHKLAGGWRGVYWGFRADEKARKECHSLHRSYMHSYVCINCFAQQQHKNFQPALCYKNFSKNAPHRLTRLSSFHQVVSAKSGMFDMMDSSLFGDGQ